MDTEKRILLSHGGGGKLTRDLINDHFIKCFNNPALSALGDSALLDINGTQVAFTTDSFVVQPIFFPGANIGHIAICGTVNDLAVTGAKPAAISAGFVIEEGLCISELERIIESMNEAACEAGVNIVTGDTKVVEKGKADKIFINTSGIGIRQNHLISDEDISSGDKIIINGTLGDHGIAVMSAREDLPIESGIKSDTAPLTDLIFGVLERFPKEVKFMRDATRGGFATVLNEVAEGKKFGIDVFEDRVPVNSQVKAVCDLLGLDPLYVANEGKAVFITKPESADKIVEFMRAHRYGKDAAVTGEITPEHPGRVVLKTLIGGGRILDMLIGDQLPRIC